MEFITEVSGDEYTFLKDWTNLFSSKLQDLFVCVLCIKYKKINKFGSRKQNCCFFRAKAQCKFSNCLEFRFRIKDNPLICKVDYINVEYTAIGTLSSEHHDGKISYARHLSKTERLQVASDLTKMPVSKYFYDQFLSSNNKELALDYGNFNKIRSANTLRKAKSDLLSLNRFSNDNWKELTELQDHYYKTINNKHFNGYKRASRLLALRGWRTLRVRRRLPSVAWSHIG